MKSLKRTIRRDYDKEHDIMYMGWGTTDVSVELFDGGLVLDVDKKDNIVGIQIFDFMNEVKRNQERINKLLKRKK